MPNATTDPRRGSDPAEESYLALVGERLRLARARRGMSRKVLAKASGVSERYLAELERGTGNASLLVMRQIAEAMHVGLADLVADGPDRTFDQQMVASLLERLTPEERAEARRLLVDRFARARKAAGRRIALIGLKGAGKTTLGQGAARALGVPFVELDREIARASGMDLAEIFAGQGQREFRRLELECLRRAIADNERCVIATGGSIVTEPASYDLLLSECFVVWLTASPREHMDRVAAQGDLRPMADSRQAMEDLEAILAGRQALYERADARIDTSGRTPRAVLEAMLELVTVPAPALR